MQPDMDRFPGLDRYIGDIYACEHFSGGNNPVWRLHGSKGSGILKCYGMPDDPDTAARLARDIAYMDWLAACPDHPGKPVHSTVLTTWQAEGACLMTESPGSGQPTRPQALQAILDGWAFLADAACDPALPEARDNALSMQALSDQLHTRLARFAGIDDPAFAWFRDQELEPLIAALPQYSDDALLPPGQYIASPSDMGPHNMIAVAGGRMAWLDFEYAGRDDPANLVSDCLLHEAPQWTVPERQVLLNGLPDRWARDGDWQHRLRQIFPLVACSWIMIVLNPFRPDIRQRLEAKGGNDGGVMDIDRLCATRLTRAAALVAEYRQNGFAMAPGG